MFLRDGANASLEEIARRAGVGSATLHRHFPSRKNLLETVYLDHVKELCDAAESLAADHAPAEALIAWLRLIGARATANNALAAAMAADENGAGSSGLRSCRAMVESSCAALLERAIGSGAVRPDIGVHDLLGLVNALALAGGGRGEENRLLMLALTGIATRPVPTLNSSLCDQVSQEKLSISLQEICGEMAIFPSLFSRIIRSFATNNRESPIPGPVLQQHR